MKSNLFLRFGIAGVWAFASLLFPAFAHAASTPAWWTSSGVIDSGEPEDNWAMANIGQLKNIATQAKAHLDTELSPGPGAWDTAYDNASPFDFSTDPDPDNFSPVTVGQLKFIAYGFYRMIHTWAPGYNMPAHLEAVGLTSADYSTLSGVVVPWAASTPAEDNFSPVTIGQLKLVFCFDLSDHTAPSTPAGVQVITTEPTAIGIAWQVSTDAGGVIGYNVYRGGVKVNSTLVAGLNFRDTGLTAATSYSYTVKAVDLSGNESGASASLSVATPASSSSGAFEVFTPLL